MNTLRDQLTAALRMECAVADGKMELHRGAGPGGMDLYAPKEQRSPRYKMPIRASRKTLFPVIPPCVAPLAPPLPRKQEVRFRGPVRPPIKGKL
jgi:hypothetical protein